MTNTALLFVVIGVCTVTSWVFKVIEVIER